MSSIPTRQLRIVPQLGFGTMGLSMSYGKLMPDEQRLAHLDHARNIGETLWDTSDFYSGRRPDIFLATKFGGVVIELENGGFGFPAYVEEACWSVWGWTTSTCGTYPHRLDGSTPVEDIVAEKARTKD